MNGSPLRRLAPPGMALLLTAVAFGALSDATLAQERPTPADQPVAAAPEPAEPTEPSSEPAKPSTSIIPTTFDELNRLLGWYFTAPFVACSFIAIWFGIERLIVLRRSRVIPRAFVERFLEHLEQGKLDPDGALQLCEDNNSPVAHVFAHGVRKWGKPSVEVEQAIIDGGERQVSQLRNHLRVLNGVSTIAPLIGLLGTVVGMILSFDNIANAQAMGKPELLAQGIGVALLTTAVGLFIAIPAMIMYLYLVSRVDSLVMEMDLLAQNVVHLISYEGLAQQSAGPAKSRSRSAAAKKKAV